MIDTHGRTEKWTSDMSQQAIFEILKVLVNMITFRQSDETKAVKKIRMMS